MNWEVIKFTNLDLEGLKQEFDEKGVVTLDNAIEPTVFEEFSTFVREEMPDWWWIYNYVYWENGEKVHEDNGSPSNVGSILKAKHMAHQNLIDGVFSYHYSRANLSHIKGCECGICAFTSKFHPDLTALCEYLVGIDLRVDETFLNRYDEGDFNGIHNDVGKGACAFVLHMTKDWKPLYGGEFFTYTDDRNTITSSVAPSYNKLVIMLIPDE